MHAPQAFFVEPGYTPAHIRATLDKFRPTMVGVESNPLWFSHGIFSNVTYEAQYVAVPWSVEHGVPVFGVDWQDVETLASFARRGLEHSRAWRPDTTQTLAARHEDARSLAAAILARAATAEGDPENLHLEDRFVWYNSPGYAETTREWWETEGRTGRPGGERGHSRFQRLQTRQDHIEEHILTLLRRYPGGRLAVVIGYSHKSDLDRRLGRHPDIRVIQLADLMPLTHHDLAAAWRPLDAIAALRESLDGVMYFFNPQGVNSERVSGLIRRLNAAGIQTGEVRYLEARYHLVTGRHDEAEPVLRLLASGGDEPFSYSVNIVGGLSVPQLARLALGQLLDLRGERAQARQVYQMLLDDLEQSAPAVPAESAFTDPGAMATDGHLAFLAVFANQAVRDIVHLLLREPWSLSR